MAHLGADWEEIAETAGCRKWNHVSAPCCRCSTRCVDALITAQMRLCSQSRIGTKTQVTVHLDVGFLASLRAHLLPDLRTAGSRGLAFTSDVGVVLKVGDICVQLFDMFHFC